MSVKPKKQHEILVQKKDLTSRSFSPSSQELFDLMHLTSCDHAIKKWRDEWMICPVCNQTFVPQMDHVLGQTSYVFHKSREDILV
jgi:hypothetical protein